MRTLIRRGAVVALLLAAVFATIPPNSAAQDGAPAARKIILKSAPVYPSLARSMNIHGVVKVQAQVAPNGVVKSIEVVGGHPLLTQSAVTAVGHWKFEPAAHETRELIEIKFDE